MKKIGLCACYDTNNYGSMLQALATCEELVALGYDYEILRYTRKPTPSLVLHSLDRIPEKLSLRLSRQRQNQQLQRYPEVREGLRLRRTCFNAYRETTFPKLSEPCDTFDELREMARHYDAVLVGSDQLWLPQGYSTGFYNLLFVPNEIPRIAYATSFGVSRIPKRRQSTAAAFLSRIEYISVREQRGAEIVKELTGREVPVVLDPTLLFNRKKWETILPDEVPASASGSVQNTEKSGSLMNASHQASYHMSPEALKKPYNPLPAEPSSDTHDNRMRAEPYIFCYFLGDNPWHRKVVRAFADRVGLPVVMIPHLDAFIESDVHFADRELYEVDPTGFVNLIRHAAYVCTDSFHGSVFSILHHKQFVTFNRLPEENRLSRNSRIDTLLAQTGLQDRRAGDDAERTIETLLSPIDYTQADRRLDALRDASTHYLANALEASTGSVE